MDWTAILDRLREIGVELGPRLLGAILILVASRYVGRIVAGLVARAMRRSGVDSIVIDFCKKVAKILVFFAMLWWALGVLQVDRTSALAILGAAGLAVGLALQGTLSNLAAGVMIVLQRPFQIGDVVSIVDKAGVVKSINFFSTHIDTLDNRRIIIPNAKVFDSVIENQTYNDLRRVGVAVGTDYSADLAGVRASLLRSTENIPGALSTPAPEVFLKQLGDSSIDWEVRVWCAPNDYWSVWQAVTDAIKSHLDKDQISIPFPQLDVHMDKV